jgi:hypothetical protein
MKIDMVFKGVQLPSQLSLSLRGVKVLINLCRFHTKEGYNIKSTDLSAIQGFCENCCGMDIVARIQCELQTAQDVMTAKAVNTLGEEYAKQWQSKLTPLWAEVGKTIQRKNT